MKPTTYLILYAILTLIAVGMLLRLIPSTLPIFIAVCAVKVVCFLLTVRFIVKSPR